VSNRSPAFDAYIAKSAEFARPILKKLRDLFHKGCPQIQETMKWSAPFFEYMGVVAGMAAFKSHIRFGFWKGKLLSDSHGPAPRMGDTKITDISQLPPDDVLLGYIREAVALNEQGVKRPPPRRKARKEALKVPAYLQAALKKNPKARATFQAFSPSHKREYIEWLTEAKQEETRQKRLATAIEWMAEGKPRMWKYMQKK
jgi:uncharacterized protein YdeI (YjbR/CyaY-like superfamily)